MSKPDTAIAIELHHPPRRRATWTAVFVVALLALGSGLLVGMHVTSSTRRPAPAATPKMPAVQSPPPAPTRAGSGAVYISPARQQLIGVRSAPVRHEHVEGMLRIVGTLAYDETRTAHIHTRVPGWIEHL